MWSSILVFVLVLLIVFVSSLLKAFCTLFDYPFVWFALRSLWRLAKFSVSTFLFLGGDPLKKSIAFLLSYVVVALVQFRFQVVFTVFA